MDLPIADHHGIASLNMPVHVVHRVQPGLALFASAAIHGGEVDATEGAAENAEVFQAEIGLGVSLEPQKRDRIKEDG